MDLLVLIISAHKCFEIKETINFSHWCFHNELFNILSAKIHYFMHKGESIKKVEKERINIV